MKFIGLPLTTREIGAQCECKRMANHEVMIVIDDEHNVVIEGKCPICPKRVRELFSLHELEHLLPIKEAL